MKKILALVLALVMAVALVACGSGSGEPAADGSGAEPAASEPADASEPAEAADESAPAEEPASDGTAEIALVCAAGSGGINDRGFFQSTYEGIQSFCEEYNHTYAYYETSENTIDALYETIDLAQMNGAKVICTSGGNFIGMMEDVFAAYPDLYFVCNEIAFTTPGENAVDYLFEAQQAGFLAGVAAVYEGYTDIGIMCGMQIRPNHLAGFGFVQGVNYAAHELGVEGITVKYWYTNSFDPSADIQAYAAGWYQDGTQLIAAFCGGAAPSIWAAAEANDGLCMGCDIDQYYESDVIITSFLKNVNVSTITGLEAWENGTFPGGEVVNFGIAEGGVGLALEHSKMVNFTQEEYDKYCDMLINDTDGLNSSLVDPDRDNAQTVPEFWELVPEHYIDLQYFE